MKQGMCFGLFPNLLVVELLEVVGFEEVVLDLFEGDVVFFVEILLNEGRWWMNWRWEEGRGSRFHP